MAAISSTSYLDTINIINEIENTLLDDIRGSYKEYLNQEIINLCLSYFCHIKCETSTDLVQHFKVRDNYFLFPNEVLIINDIAVPYLLAREQSNKSHRFVEIMNLICKLVGKVFSIKIPDNGLYHFLANYRRVVLVSPHSIILNAEVTKQIKFKDPSHLFLLMIKYNLLTFKLPSTQSLIFFDIEEIPKKFEFLKSYLPQEWHVENYFLEDTKKLRIYKDVSIKDEMGNIVRKTLGYKITGNFTFSINLYDRTQLIRSMIPLLDESHSKSKASRKRGISAIHNDESTPSRSSRIKNKVALDDSF